MMFYKEKEEPELREELFENPGAAYRGAPFWAWNKKLNKKELVDQVEQFKKMGLCNTFFSMAANMGVCSVKRRIR